MVVPASSQPRTFSLTSDQESPGETTFAARSGAPAGGHVVSGAALTPNAAFPIAANAYATSGKGIVLWIDPAVPTSRRYGTFLGTIVNGAAVDGSGIITAVGLTGPAFGATPGALQTQYPGGAAAGMIARLLPSNRGTRQLHYLSYFGGQASSSLPLASWCWKVVLDELGDATVVGHSWDPLLPVECVRGLRPMRPCSRPPALATRRRCWSATCRRCARSCG